MNSILPTAKSDPCNRLSSRKESLVGDGLQSYSLGILRMLEWKSLCGKARNLGSDKGGQFRD